MRSLRGRLVAILLLVALGGMIVLAAVTFAEQRNFLYDRLDKQVDSSFFPAAGQLAFAAQTGTNSCTGVAHRNPLEEGGRDHPEGDSDSGPENPRGGGPGLSLPPGTYGAIISSNGSVLADCTFGYESGPVPDFSGETLTREPQTIESKGEDSTKFRVAARSVVTGEKVIVAIPLTDTEQTINRLLVVEAIVIAFALAILGVAAWVLVGIGLRPLDKIGRTADAIAGGDLSHRVEPADGRSEIGRLGLALNRMLHSLEGAFKEREASENRLRQFLADASHELRTPLVSIRGYAELYRLGVTPDEEEVRRSMERIEQEAARMGVLVEDMLSLARLDETHENRYKNVDLAEIAAGAVRDAEVAAPDRTITLHATGAQKVVGDADQLQQVLANLLRNAIVHTDDGTAIDVSIARSGDDVRLDVRDHGKGLPDGAGPQIFDRFWRSEGGRERGKAGSGLGLAIVAEIVAAHGGRVHAKNAEEGKGAVFSVWLPIPSATNDLSQLPA